LKLYYITRVNIPSKAAQSVQIASMCEAFNTQGINFKLLSTLNEENIKLKKSFLWDKIKLNSRFKYLEFVIKSTLKVKEEKPTHIFTRDIVVAFTLSFFDIRVVYEAHKEPRTKIANFIINNLKKKNNFLLVTISKALKNYYINDYSFKDSKIVDCHDAVFIENYDKYRNIPKNILRKELDLPQDKTIIMHTGSLHKGNDAKLFKIVIENFKDLLFVQVGGTKQDISKYKQYYKNNNNIVFIRHQNHKDIIKYQMSADLLFYALTKTNQLWWCTSPLKIFEYMATGIPILNSNIGSVSEVLNELNSIPFSPEDEQTIINGVNYFLENKAEIKHLAIRALIDIKDKYTWDKRAISILEFIK
jgi:glycosyltransferase involved in cell wall biosynthesis